MPIKAHVKGKRKAPPPPSPPIKLAAQKSNENPSINQTENKFPNSAVGNGPKTMACFTIQTRKKPAPLPPIRTVAVNVRKEKHGASGDEMNNLSAISKRITDKSTVKAINLNIFEPNNIRNNFQCGGLAKENNEVNVNLDSNPKYDTFAANDVRHHRNDQIWICAHCTLQNPFWKIICDACERIKPYNTPTIPITNPIPNTKVAFKAHFDDDSSVRANEKNLMSSVMMRPKMCKSNNKSDGDKILNRNSMNVDRKSASSSKELPSKRNSLCLIKYGDQNITPEALEMEKERIRCVIRAMNNRAIAQKHSKKLDIHIEEATNELDATAAAAAKTATINKKAVAKRNGHLKYDTEKDYNLPSVRRNANDAAAAECSSTRANDLTGKTQAIRPIKKIENSDKNAKYSAFIGDIRTYCDQMSLANTPKKLQHDANEQKYEHPIGATKNSLKCGIEKEIALNLYINFNNAIEVKANKDFTLDEFRLNIFQKIIPCTRPKIYFNGLLMRNGNQTLANYGVTDQSSLYINTENVVVQAHAKNEKTSAVIQSDVQQPCTTEAKEDEKIEKINDVKTPNKSLFDDVKAKNADGEKFLIEHVQLNRYTIERVAPQDTNINKVKYRGVYNYNPRCNPEFLKTVTNQPENSMKKPLSQTTQDIIAKVTPNKSTKSLHTIPDAVKNKPITEYIELLSLDDSMALTQNSEVFECTVCFVEYQPLEGVILRNCLHTFCKDCIRNTIIYSDEAEVKCPYIDEQYSCGDMLQDREIKALLSKSDYDDHLTKSLRIAEHQIENSFHCKTPDCKGWCIFEDDVNIFKCPICRLENCLTCRVIHDGLDCKQYQNMMKNNLDKNPENATTHTMLQEMIKNGEAMNCPACKIVLMKKWGCDWLKCSMCKTEICWITRGYRWGPGGKGDTSAGCKCGVDGFKCHPKCNYCH